MVLAVCDFPSSWEALLEKGSRTCRFSDSRGVRRTPSCSVPSGPRCSGEWQKQLCSGLGSAGSETETCFEMWVVFRAQATGVFRITAVCT